VRLNEKGRLVERIVIKIKVFENGKWEWQVRQRFLKEPHIKTKNFFKILDEMKAEIAQTEGIEIESNSSPQLEQSLSSLKKSKKKKITKTS
jgi:hypothetical protein